MDEFSQRTTAIVDAKNRLITNSRMIMVAHRPMSKCSNFARRHALHRRAKKGLASGPDQRVGHSSNALPRRRTHVVVHELGAETCPHLPATISKTRSCSTSPTRTRHREHQAPNVLSGQRPGRDLSPDAGRALHRARERIQARLGLPTWPLPRRSSSPRPTCTTHHASCCAVTAALSSKEAVTGSTPR